jgi:hypothetical protein
LNFGEVSVRWRRLGQRYPLRGYYYYMRINVALANRGQPLLQLPPDEPRPAGLSLPLLTNVWYSRPEPLPALCVRSKPQAAPPGFELPKLPVATEMRVRYSLNTAHTKRFAPTCRSLRPRLRTGINRT